MIQLDSNFQTVEAKEGKPYAPPPAGGYILEVVGASEEPSQKGNAMVTLELDIADGEFAGAFEKYPKKVFQLVNGEHLPYFKAMLGYFKNSNPENKMREVVFQNRDGSFGFDGTKLIGLRVGGNIREAEYIDKNGGLSVGPEVAWLGAVKDVPLMKVLPLKKIASGTGNRAPSAARPTTRPASAAPGLQPEDDLPF